MQNFVKELGFIGMYIAYVAMTIVVLGAYVLVSVAQKITYWVMTLYRGLHKELFGDGSKWDYLSRRLISKQIDSVAKYEKIK